MAHIYDYFKRSQTTEIPSSLTKEEVKQADELVEKVREASEPKCRGKYATYTSTERAKSGKYAAENGTTRAIRFFSQHWKRNIPEATVRHLKGEYLQQLDKQKDTDKPVESLPTKPQGRPLLVGGELDQAIKDYLVSLMTAGGVVNTAITLPAAEGIITARYPGKLQKQCGDLCIGKDWADSLLKHM